MNQRPRQHLKLVHRVDPADVFEAHLLAERKRKITIVLGVLFALWYLLYLAKPILAQRPDIGLYFVSVAPIAIGIWLWSKPVSRIYGEMEIRLEASELFEVLIQEMELPFKQQTFSVRITREPDYISSGYKHNEPAAKGSMTIDLTDGEEFTGLAWSVHFDGRVTSDNAHFVQHEINEWLRDALYGWL